MQSVHVVIGGDDGLRGQERDDEALLKVHGKQGRWGLLLQQLVSHATSVRSLPTNACE